MVRGALACVASFAPEVVVLDIGLPGLHGYEVAGRLRQMPQTAQSLLIALTGYGQAGDRLQTLQAGFGAHLVKPADPQELVQVIADWRGNCSKLPLPSGETRAQVQ